ncbi:MAG: hypothetical protein IJX97_05930 [Clostridia bacterium]|nr:hypothetical protein [Clostridia bacterium]
MNKEKFIKDYKLSDAVPIDPTLVLICASGYGEAIRGFINDEFRGIARVEGDLESQKYVFICTEYAAFFFKQMLADIYGRVLINIKIKENENNMEITISSEEEIPLSERELRRLIKIARNAGMDFFINGNTYRLTLAFVDTVTNRVYAISLYDGERIMLSKLSEIFHCGAVSNTANGYAATAPECEPRYMDTEPVELFPSPSVPKKGRQGKK